MTNPCDSAAATAPHVLLEPWAGPYGGVPPFDQSTPALLQPALEAGMAEHLAELERIAKDPAPPTFANTIAAMERSGRALDRASTIYYIFSATLSDAAVQQVERVIEPKMAAFRDSITQNEKLFARIAAVYESRERSGLTPEEQRLTWLVYTNVARDYVEFPSQLLEHWLPVKEILDRFAVHYQSGTPLPAELVAKVEKAKTFNQGFATVEYLSSGTH